MVARSPSNSRTPQQWGERRRLAPTQSNSADSLKNFSYSSELGWILSANEFIGLAADWSAIPIGIIGFGITIFQIMRTKSIARAALRAAKEAKRGLGGEHLTLLVPVLVRIEGELDESASKGDLTLALHSLREWRWNCIQIKKVLLQSYPEKEAIAKNLQHSISSCVEAKETLLRSADSSVYEATLRARNSISRVTNDFGDLLVLEIPKS